MDRSATDQFNGYSSPPPAYDDQTRPGSSTPRSAWQDEPTKQHGGSPSSNNQHYPEPPPVFPWAVPPPGQPLTTAYSGCSLQPGYYPTTGMVAGYHQPPLQYFGFAPAPSIQQQVMVIGHGQTPVQIQAVESFCAHIILACFVTWFCNIVLGAIAFALAMMASNAAVTNPRGAHQLGRASYSVSVVGIVCTVIVITLVISITMSGSKTCTGYPYSGRCYRSYCNTCTSSTCASLGGRYASNGFCYYNSY